MKKLAAAAVLSCLLATPALADGTAPSAPTAPAVPSGSPSSPPPATAASPQTAAAQQSIPANMRNAKLIEVLEINGMIDDGTPNYIRTHLEEINDNPHVKAIVLKLDTPGGGSAASAAAREELGKASVPVVVWCDSICASGGIYLATAKSVKWIAVRESTIAGSIGVIAHLHHYEKLLDWARVDSVTYKSGGADSVKDAGNPEHAPSPNEQAEFQAIIDRLADNFYAVVKEARGDKISSFNWGEIKAAKVFIGSDAVKIGLVDAVMTYDEAVAKAKELSGEKQIYTRKEMDDIRKQLTAASNDASDMPKPQMGAPKHVYDWADDAHFLATTLKDAINGSGIEFQYLMPMRF